MNRSADLEALTRTLLPGYRAPGVGCEGLETCALVRGWRSATPSAYRRAALCSAPLAGV